MKAVLAAVAVAVSGAAQAVPEVEAVPPEAMVKAWTLTVTLGTSDPNLLFADATSATVIDGFANQLDCRDAGMALMQALRDAVLAPKAADLSHANVSFGCKANDLQKK